ncbi:ribonuclease toxin immunity protein CdiI [Myxococcus xanthus]|uniref:ribonuclease toxin immunity protein CdiI n=1 Tax=Myxococcus xanthus TaxID=34 RepID=UPI001260169B|nr:ribonuclease toxin immunity protein CdiI [Myxococcus xanthus]
MPKRLNLVGDDDPLFPGQAFFNSISERGFVEKIQQLVARVGAEIDGAQCEFPGDLEPWEPKFEGVRFSLYEDVVVVEEPVFQMFLLEACRMHVKDHPEDRARLAQILGEGTDSL